MPGLTFIPGLSPSTALLLEGVGIDKPFALAQQDPEDLLLRLIEANRRRQLLHEEPTLYNVRRWVDNARALVDSCAPPPARPRGSAQSGDLNLDDIPEVIVLDHSPDPPTPPAEWHRPVRKSPEFGGKYVRGNSPSPFELAGSEDDVSSDPEDGEGPMAKPLPLKPQIIAANDPDRRNPDAGIWKEVDKQRFRDFGSYVSGSSGIAPLPRKDDSARSRHVREDQSSRRVRRGVPYPRPKLLMLGALIVILWRVLFLVVLIGTPLALAPAFMGHEIGPVLKFLWVIGAWVVCSVFYLYLATRIRCRVCTNQIFFSKRCFKNAKAHRFPGLGLVGSLALHALFFGWFRCMYCGTAIRVRR
ncbi:MAG: DUF4332 domain-containing protein [Verrucomicrobiales bacterium]